MPRRKRTNSSEPYSFISLTKRQRRSSGTVPDQASVPFGSQGKLWKVRDIISENATKYLIDWESDAETGEKFQPTWEPKHYANAQAVHDWKRKQSKPNRQSSLTKSRASTIESYTVTDSPPRVTRARRRQIIDSSSSPAKDGQQSEYSSTQESPGILDSQLPLISSTASQSELLVQISPHSSLARSQYPEYLASISSQVEGYSQQDQLDSGIGESSPAPHRSPYAAPISSRILPDSQNGPNSSSYIHTNTGSSVSQNDSQRKIEASSVSGSKSRPDDKFSSLPYAASSDPVEGGASSCKNLRRTASSSRPSATQQPQKAVTESPTVRVSSRTRRHPLRVLSSPEREAHDEPFLASTESCNRFFLAPTDPKDVFVNSSAFEPLAEGTTTDSRVALPASVNQDLVSSEHQLESQQNFPADSASQDLLFQTQVPLAIDSQTSERATGTTHSSGELWQSAQQIAAAALSSSQASSEGAWESTVLGDDRSIGKDPQETALRVFPAGNSALTDSEIRGSPVFSQRDPNSQPGKVFQSAQPKEDFVVTSIESPELATVEISHSLPAGPPSQVSEVFESDIPSRPVTPSDMDVSGERRSAAGTVHQKVPLGSLSSGSSVGERPKSIRAAPGAAQVVQAAAKRSNSGNFPVMRTTKSPSVIPEPALHESIGDSRLEVRTIDMPLAHGLSQTKLHTPTYPSRLHLHKEMSELHVANSFGCPRLSRMEFVVPLSLPSMVKDQYIQLLDYYKSSIRRFHEEDSIDPTLDSTIQLLLNRLNNVTNHIDLENSTTLAQTQSDVDMNTHASWARDCSTKFLFLEHLIQNLRFRKVHIVIVADGGRLLDLLENFLRGICVGYVRPDTGSKVLPRTNQEPMVVSLVGSHLGPPSGMLLPIHLVVAFNLGVDVQVYTMHRERTYGFIDGRMVPVVHLLVNCSAEHITRCIPDSVPRIDRLRMIVECVARNREKIGMILPEEFNTVAAAEEVAAFTLRGGFPQQWTLLSIKPIDTAGLDEKLSQASQQSTQSEAQVTLEDGTVTAGLHKRPLSMSDSSSTNSKRKRMTPVPDVTHISDSVAQSADTSSQIISDLRFALDRAEFERSNLQKTHAAREDELQNSVSKYEQQLQEHWDALGGLQQRYEKRNEEYHMVRHECDNLVATITVTEKKRENLLNQYAKLTEEHNALHEELEIAKRSLRASTVPQVAELETLKMNVRTLANEKALLERKNKSLLQDFEFTRQQYQVASSAAVEARNRSEELEAENAVLSKKASGEAVRLREATINNALETQVGENERLAAENADLQELLRKKERGKGVTTRTGSVAPKSPRLGNSPAGSRAGSRAPRSRPGSPVRSFLGVRKGRGPID